MISAADFDHVFARRAPAFVPSPAPNRPTVPNRALPAPGPRLPLARPARLPLARPARRPETSDG